MKRLLFVPLLFLASIAFGQFSITPQDSYTISGLITTSAAPLDGITYYFGVGGGITIAQHQTYAACSMLVPKAGTITRIGWQIFVVTNGSNESVQHFLRKNDTTDTTLSTTETYDPGANTPKTFSYTGLSIPVAAGDTIVFKVVCPTWATNPTIQAAHLQVFIQ